MPELPEVETVMKTRDGSLSLRLSKIFFYDTF